MNENDDTSYLGKGWSFPPSFNKQENKISMVVNEEDVKQSLQILLSTKPGERIMQPTFGCNLDIMVFEPMTTSLITYVKDLVKKAILFHEARINVNKIDISTQEINSGLILIDID